MSNFNYVEDVQRNVDRLDSKEQILGKGLNIPFNGTNSGSRKIMDDVHQSHALVLSRGEVPYVATGYENRFGDKSSSIIVTDNATYQVIAKIPKFSEAPNHHYWLLMADAYSNRLHVVERISYNYITEIYGYLVNNTVLDSLSVPGTIIRPSTTLRRSTGFDQYGNKTNGTNLNIVYLSNDNNMEDSVIISDECARKMSAPLIKKVKRVINENDIPLNLYGNNSMYKTFPDIGEDVQHGILFAFRREDRENAIYAQSVARLQQLMMSDDKTTINGKVIDIDIYCNNPENLANSISNSQFNKYFLDRQRMCTEIVQVVSPLVSQGYALSYDLQKLFAHCKDELSGKEFMGRRKFSNVTIEVIIMEEVSLNIGDKVADRYGGKGVVSKIRQHHLMPKLPNGQYADMIKNSHTMNNRENPGQIFEMSINFISMSILDNIRKSQYMDIGEAFTMILTFLEILCYDEALYTRNYIGGLSDEDKEYFLASILEKDCIYLSSEPLSDRMDIDLIGELYEAFPWIDPPKLTVPITDSNGNIRYIETRRSVIIAKQYTYRLKQLAEEKFSSTSASSTNLRSENAKSKASKDYKAPYSSTPIRFGPMETGHMGGHMGTDIVIVNMMILSLSPMGRRAIEEIFVGDPYDVDIKLSPKAKNRSVEQSNAKLKAMGYKIVFKKKRRIYTPAITFEALEFEDCPTDTPAIEFVSDKYDMDHWYKTIAETEDALSRCAITMPAISFYGDGKKEEEED